MRKLLCTQEIIYKKMEGVDTVTGDCQGPGKGPDNGKKNKADPAFRTVQPF